MLADCIRRRLLRCFAKIKRKALGNKMKKLVILLLAFALLCLTGCDILTSVGIMAKPTVSQFCEIANASKPTKITTEVSLVTDKGDTLSGYYVTTTDGTNVIFEYNYERLATPAESIESDSSDRIMVIEGVINYKDGVFFSGDEEQWKPGTGTAFDLKFNADKKVLKDATVSEDGTTLEAKLGAEDLAAIIGTDLGAVGEASLTLVINGVNLTTAVVSCDTANGTVTVRTSYTYNVQNLFPEVEDGTLDSE